MRKTLLFSLLIAASISMFGQGGSGMPAPVLRTDLIPKSPNAAAFEKYGQIPVALYNGQMNYSIPIFTAKDGDLALDISLTYNYNGCRPLESASWTGLGWNLNAGGVITRTVGDKLDGTMSGGGNYDQYSVTDSLISRGFMAECFQNDSYDKQPDVYSYNFAGHSGRFIIFKSKVYLFSYEHLKIENYGLWFTITTDDGTVYTFAATETTRPKPVLGSYVPEEYVSAWYLTEITSANGKNQIVFNYSETFVYRAPLGASSQVFTVNSVNDAISSGCGTSDKSASSVFTVSPLIDAIVLKSIETRSAKIEFDTISRPPGNIAVYPALGTIRINNKGFSTNNLIGQWKFNYDDYPGRLFLTKVYQTGADTLVASPGYRFEYETGVFPVTYTNAVDNWGYYNGQTNNTCLFPDDAFTVLAGSFFPANRRPDANYAKLGILKKITYPTGGSSSFEYEANMYYDEYSTASKNKPGPGVRIKRIINNDSLNGKATYRLYKYLSEANDSITSGVLFSRQAPYTVRNTTNVIQNPTGAEGGCLIDRTIYQANYAADPRGLQFYYSRVSEIDSSLSQRLETQYSFLGYEGLDVGTKLIKKQIYLSYPDGSKSELNRENYYYYGGQDTAFYGILSVYKSYETAYGGNVNDIYAHESIPMHNVAWMARYKTESYTFDANGQAQYSLLLENYDAKRYVNSTVMTTSAGDTIFHQFKYPYQYATAITNKLNAKNITGQALEHQVWIKEPGGTKKFYSGEIDIPDTVSYKTVEKHLLEANPLITLDNETKTNGLYTSLISDSRYKKRMELTYDALANLSLQKLANNTPVAILWDYNATVAVAQVMNADTVSIAYAGFESFSSGNWLDIVAGNIVTDTTSITGSHHYHLTASLRKPNLNATADYTVSYWSKSGSLTVNGTSGTSGGTNRGWTFYTHKIVHPAGGLITITGNAYIDELRLYPVTAQMSTVAYNPLVGVVSECDTNNRIMYYRYDALNRLVTVRDQDFNVIRTVDYHYKGQ